VKLGMLNSRMKDFFDLWHLSKDFSFDGKTLAAAISASFETRGTAVPSEIPFALTAEFHDDREKNVQWNAFLNKSGLSADARSLREIAAILPTFSCRSRTPTKVSSIKIGNPRDLGSRIRS